MKSGPIKRHGGKAYLAAAIRALFPKHVRYCEPFFGGGAVLLAGDGKGVAEYANDIDDHLANFWKVLRHREYFKDFLRLAEATPLSEPEFRRAKSGGHDPSDDPPLAAWQFFILNRQSRQALGKDFATPTTRLRRGMNEQVSAWLSAVDGLPEFHQRLRRVEIRCMDAVGFIRELDSPDTLFYCDPPYVHATRTATKAYEHEMDDQQHRELLAVLANIAGKFILSGYPNSLYDHEAECWGWRHIDFDLPNQASSAKTKERKTERVWLNYDPPAAGENGVEGARK